MGVRMQWCGWSAVAALAQFSGDSAGLRWASWSDVDPTGVGSVSPAEQPARQHTAFSSFDIPTSVCCQRKPVVAGDWRRHRIGARRPPGRPSRTAPVPGKLAVKAEKRVGDGSGVGVQMRWRGLSAVGVRVRFSGGGAGRRWACCVGACSAVVRCVPLCPSAAPPGCRIPRRAKDAQHSTRPDGSPLHFLPKKQPSLVPAN